MGGVSMEWKEDILGNVLEVKYGKDHKKLADGHYPVYGSGGLMRYVDSKLYDGPSILIPRKGTLNNIMFVESPFWTVDTMFWSIINTDKVDPKFLFYSICKRDFASMNVGSAVPSMTVNILNDIQISYPKNIEDQHRIAYILSSLDRKIELNNKINADLEEMAQAIFKNWFVDFEPFKDGKFVDSELGMIPEGWKVGCLGDIAQITSGKRPPKKSKDKTKDLSIPLIGASDIMGFTSDVLYERPILVIGRVGTHGVVQRFQEKCWPSDNTLVIESSYYNYVYQLLKGIDYSAINRGSTQPLITQTDVKNTDVIIAPENVLKEYESITSTLFSKHRANIKENSRLSLLRDTLLPRLMSGEIEIPE